MSKQSFFIGGFTGIFILNAINQNDIPAAYAVAVVGILFDVLIGAFRTKP